MSIVYAVLGVLTIGIMSLFLIFGYIVLEYLLDNRGNKNAEDSNRDRSEL